MLTKRLFFKHQLKQVTKECCCKLSLSFPSAQSTLPPNLVVIGSFKEKILKNDVDIKELENTTPVPSIESANNVRSLQHATSKHKTAVPVWVDDFMEEMPKFDRAASLHPAVFDVHPRMDILHEVVRWQERYREVDYAWTRTRAEMGRGKKKPWPQKGTGKVRQGSSTPPHWKKGGIAHGPRGPISLYYKPNDSVLTQGLTVALTVKLIQNDLIVADSMDIPLASDSYFDNLLTERNIADSTVLYVHRDHECPIELGRLLEHKSAHNLMPLSALNVWSILKHDKLVLALDVLDELEEKIMWQQTKYEWLGKPHNFYRDMPGRKYAAAQPFN